MRLLKILNFCFRKVFKVSRVPIRFNIPTEWMLKNFKGPPFTVFGIVRFFEMNNFCLKIRFSQAQHPLSNFCFFFKDWCFYATFFSNLFSSKLPSIFTRNETFCEHKGLLKVFGTVRFTGDLQLEMFSKNDEFFLNFLFLMFSVEKDGFFAVSSWRRMVFEIYAYPFGYFLAL